MGGDGCGIWAWGCGASRRGAAARTEVPWRHTEVPWRSAVAHSKGAHSKGTLRHRGLTGRPWCTPPLTGRRMSQHPDTIVPMIGHLCPIIRMGIAFRRSEGLVRAKATP